MSETAAPKNKTLKVAEVAVDGAEPVVNAVATICSEVEAAANAAIPLGNFLPLIREMSRLLQEMVDINENAVSNKRICRVMLEKVTTAGSVIINLEKDGNLLTEEYYFYLRELVTVADKIRKFLEEISQLKGLSKYIQANKIENTAMDLNKKLDLTIQILQFASELLPYNDFEEVEVGESVGKKIKKYKRIKNGINDFVALKLVADEAKNNIKNLVTILRKLEECDNIIQFFGLAIIDGNKWFLVTEWAEYGNLREFYNTFGPLDVKAKVLFAIDISRGLSFLSAVEIVHCDIRAENILITDHQTAKIANFSSSKAVTDVTKNHKTTLERVRYCAPENSEKLGTQTKYNTKSEVYSFGILLWEIAEEKVPYANYNDIMAITELVGEKKYREPFSDASPLPKEYQDIAKKAVDHDPNYRPSFTKIFTVLQDLYTKTSSNSIGSSSPIGSEWIKKKMEEEDINYFEYNEFSKPIPIGKGGFGFVHKAETNDKKQVALKGLIDSVIDENVIKNFVKELKLLRMVSYHDNINRFLGITKDNIGYVMVLEYANEGNLREYLEKKFDSLQWENKIQMALDITRGLLCLHSRNIIHRDLHSKNILVNNGKLLIADFGLSKQLTEVTSNSTSNRMGIIEYVEPQCIRNVNYVKDKRSDVYSLGVLLWEITSGRPPFCHMVERDMLGYHISRENLREEPMEGTPLEYQQLYQKCWDGDPEKRPDINQIYKEILSQSNVNDISEQSEDSLVNNDSLDNLNIQSAQSDLCIKTELVL